ncbi:copper chaperone PCu(A)C [Roseicyclus sp.]|uniref:copper chaperone PCu(A)C n=1 Tax=Roseicyclus sp. TaxID=1914329 RepID=UPI001BCFD4B7|nr:copper chaperone PCu(A)C [Roseicyclus sp.]
MRFLAATISLAFAATPLLAQDDHKHLTEIDGLRIVHAWMPATSGPDAMIYMEIENGSDGLVTLSGAEAPDGMTVELVGFTYTDGVEAWQVLPAMPIAAGGNLDLAPRGVALRISGLSASLVEGDEIEIEVLFGDLRLDVHVEVEDKNATAHGHAGHNH